MTVYIGSHPRFTWFADSSSSIARGSSVKLHGVKIKLPLDYAGLRIHMRLLMCVKCGGFVVLYADIVSNLFYLTKRTFHSRVLEVLTNVDFSKRHLSHGADAGVAAAVPCIMPVAGVAGF
jgi:hypothetical protein